MSQPKNFVHESRYATGQNSKKYRYRRMERLGLMTDAGRAVLPASVA